MTEFNFLLGWSFEFGIFTCLFQERVVLSPLQLLTMVLELLAYLLFIDHLFNTIYMPGSVLSRYICIISFKDNRHL